MTQNITDMLATALRELLQHANIADSAPEDVDGEDHERESNARKALCAYAAYIAEPPHPTQAETVVTEEMAERAARAHYEHYFEAVLDLEPKWREGNRNGYWDNMVGAMNAALQAALNTKSKE